MDLQLSEDLYPLFRDLLLTRSGLYYPERKRDDLAYGLSQAARSCDYADLRSLYVDVLKGGPIWETVLEHLTIGETYFFRNRPQFDALEQHVLPELLQRQKKMHSVRFWSAGCATGEEPYSLAIAVNKALANQPDWQISILATDINATFLSRARDASYSNWSFRETSDAIRAQFFEQEGNRWRLCPEIRRQVMFARLNLADENYPSLVNGTCALDLILCRNVMIYFDEPTILRVVERLYHALAPGGWLLVGHAEPQARIFCQFEVHNFPGAVVYRKPLDAPMFSLNLPRGSLAAGTRMPVEHGTLPPGQVWQAQTQAAVARPAVAQTSEHRERTPETGPRSGQSGRAPITRPLTPPASKATGTQPLTLPSSQVSVLWNAIEEHLRQDDRDGAEVLLRDFLRLMPDHVRALVALAQIYADRGNWSAARQSCEEALTHDPLSIQAHFILAQIYEHQSQLDQSLAAYRRTVYLDRNFIAGMLGMANVWRQMGRVVDAARGYRNVLRQLASMDSGKPVTGMTGVTVGELTLLINRQLQSLPSQAD